MLVALAADAVREGAPPLGASVAALDLQHWGLDAEGKNEHDALTQLLAGGGHTRFAAFLASHGETCIDADDVTVVAHQGRLPDEGAFDFEREAATPEERDRTIELHGWARADLLQMLGEASDEQLDWADPARQLPDWAWWDTARKMAWHCAITETRYYLGRLGVDAPEPFAQLASPFPVPTTLELTKILAISQEHVNRWIDHLPKDLVVEVNDEVWTTRKVLRRLASHERGENYVTASLLAKARLALAESS